MTVLLSSPAATTLLHHQPTPLLPKQPRAFTQRPVTAPVNQTGDSEEAGDAEDDGKCVPVTADRLKQCLNTLIN